MSDEFPNLSSDGKKFNPWEFGAMLPDNEITRQFSLGPWHELSRHLYLFLMHVMPSDYNQLSVAEEPGEEIEKRCDDWIRTFVNTSDRKGIDLPNDLRKWAAVRTRRALVLAEKEAVSGEKYKEPNMRQDFAHEITSRLIDHWHAEGKKQWLLNPGKSSADEVTTVTWHLKRKGIKLKPATTWAEVMKLADTILELVDLKDRYPVGKTCSDLHNDMCDLWLREVIFADDRADCTPEPDYAPWLAARLFTAKTLMKSYVRDGRSAPSPEGNAQQALYVMVVPQWKETLSNIWRGFHYQKGKLAWDPSRCETESKFSGN